MTTPALGVFTGGSSDKKETGVQAFEAWLDRTVNFTVDFAAQDTFASMQSDGTWAIWAWNQANPHRRLMFSVPLAMPGVPLSAVVAGTYDAQFQAVAQSMQWFQPTGWVRLGWEFNGSWYAWCPANTGNSTADFIAAYRHVAAIFRATCPGARLIWNPSCGENNVAPDTCYPGDDVVDFIGVDIYDKDFGIHDPAPRWDGYLTQPYGLNWIASFAAEHYKPIAVPEWGAGAAGDNPLFITNMFEWMAANNVALQSYWDDGPTSGYNGQIDGGQYPLQAAAYKSAVQMMPARPVAVWTEAVNYMTGGEGVGYHTGHADLGSAQPRSDSMDIYADSATGSGYGLGWLYAGTWYAYEITLAADANYTFQMWVQSWASGGTCHFEVDGVNVTGSQPMDGSDPLSAPVALKAGPHTVRWVIDNPTGQNLRGFNIAPQ